MGKRSYREIVEEDLKNIANFISESLDLEEKCEVTSDKKGVYAKINFKKGELVPFVFEINYILKDKALVCYFDFAKPSDDDFENLVITNKLNLALPSYAKALFTNDVISLNYFYLDLNHDMVGEYVLGTFMSLSEDGVLEIMSDVEGVEETPNFS